MIGGAVIIGAASIPLYKSAFASPALSGSSSLSTDSSVLQASVNIDPHPHMTDTSKIVSGQALMNDRRPSPEYTPEETGEFVSDQISIYVVREGDTLSGIAHMFGVTENTIRWANDLSAKSTLKKDQQLIILPISGVKYVVKKGDTLKSIASSFNADKQEILSFNNFDSETEIKAGEEIIIPNGEVTTTVSSASTKSSTSGAGKTSGSTSAYFTRPVKGGVRTQGIHGHNGVDLASSLGAPIYAAAAGKIIIAKSGGWNGGYGNYVVISHSNGTQTLYGHLNTVNVTVGQSVTQGAKIGGMGNTGDSTGVHLHFEVRGGKNPF